MPENAGKQVRSDTSATDATTPNNSPDTVLNADCKTTAKQQDVIANNTDESDPDLSVVIDAWPTLPEAVKVAILAMMKAINP